LSGKRFSQEQVDEFESPTNGYTLLNGGVGTNLKVANHRLLIFIAAKNILNKKYYNHFSNLKEKEIHEMGSNFIFGLQIPFGMK
jgi:iron complex outermembrane receptor protein